MHRRTLIIAAAAALAAAAAIPAAHGAGAPAPRAAAAQGTVSVTPSILETTARPGREHVDGRSATPRTGP